MTEDTRPWVDQYRNAAEDAADKESAAQLLEDMKSAVMAKKQAMLGGDIPVNRAEQTVKASRDWERYVQSCVDARKEANLAKVKVEFIRMRFAEEQSRAA